MTPPAALTSTQLAAAWIVFLASYLVFALGKFPGLKIDRPGAAIIGGVAMVAARVVRPADAPGLVDFATPRRGRGSGSSPIGTRSFSRPAAVPPARSPRRTGGWSGRS